MTAAAILDREFLEIRAKILELAASFDRLERADGSATSDPRWSDIMKGLRVLANDSANRAEQVQMIFSLAFDDEWKKKPGRQFVGKASDN